MLMDFGLARELTNPTSLTLTDLTKPNLIGPGRRKINLKRNLLIPPLLQVSTFR